MVGVREEGMDVNARPGERPYWRAAALAAFGCLLLAGCGNRSELDTEGQLTVDMIVNYDGNIAQGTWAPVDVLVMNDARDIEGYVEVRTVVAGMTQSPVYRVPVDSPKGSMKRFRTYAFAESTGRMEAMLYNGRRAVLDVPAVVDLAPMDPDDLQVLVLDDEYAEYGFLNTVFQGGGEERRRIFRKNLTTDVLSRLPDHVACLEPYDLVIVGDIDPDRISPPHRSMLMDYVRQGGRLAICTGSRAQRLRDSWLAELAGIEIGSIEVLPEEELASAVFGVEAHEQARANFDVAYAVLEAAAPLKAEKGGAPLLASLRSYGAGTVAAFAVSPHDAALIPVEAYRHLWRDLLTGETQPVRPRLALAGQSLARDLPSAANIQIFSRGAVTAYLFLYLLVGVVLNWLFFAVIKRRAMAWAGLLVCSLAFTGYALVFGTVGRAGESRLFASDVLEWRAPDTAAAERHSFLGVLSAGTATYDFDLTAGPVLATETGAWTPQNFGGQDLAVSRPFAVRQGNPSRIEGLRIGASELRLLRASTPYPVQGGFRGAVIAGRTVEGGVVENRTGLDISAAGIVYRGAVYPVEIDGPRLTVRKAPHSNLHDMQSIRMALPDYGRYGRTHMQFLTSLFSDHADPWQQDGQAFSRDFEQPWLLALAERPLPAITNLDIESRSESRLTLLVSPLDAELPPFHDASGPEIIPLRATIDDGYTAYEMVDFPSMQDMPSHHASVTRYIRPEDDALELHLAGLPRDRSVKACTLILKAGIAMRRSEVLTLSAANTGEPLTEFQISREEARTPNGFTVVYHEYEIPGERLGALQAGNTGAPNIGAAAGVTEISLRLERQLPPQERPAGVELICLAGAELRCEPGAVAQGAWPAWQ